MAKKFTCSICGKIFRNQSQLTNHIRIAHPIPPPEPPLPPPEPPPFPPPPIPVPEPSIVENLLAITVSYPDFPVKETTEVVNLNIMRQFFLENSYGKYDLRSTFAGVYQTSFSINENQIDVFNEIFPSIPHNLNDFDYLLFIPVHHGVRLNTYTTTEGKTLLIQHTSTSLSVMIHETGHILRGNRLSEASVLRCGDQIIKPAFPKTCTMDIYDDMFDVMGGGGWGYIGHLNAANKDRLRFFSSEEIAEVSQSGTFTLTPYESVGGLKALKIPRGIDSSLYVEYRRPFGFDAFYADLEYRHPGISGVFEGALIHTQNPQIPGQSLLIGSILTSEINALPIGAQWGIGSKYIDPATGATIEIISKTDQTLVINVNPGIPDLTLPVITNVFPAEFTTVSGIVQIEIVVSDNNPVLVTETNAQLFGPPFQYNLDSTLYPNGYKFLNFYAYDAAGNRSELFSRVLKINN